MAPSSQGWPALSYQFVKAWEKHNVKNLLQHAGESGVTMESFLRDGKTDEVGAGGRPRVVALVVISFLTLFVPPPLLPAALSFGFLLPPSSCRCCQKRCKRHSPTPCSLNSSTSAMTSRKCSKPSSACRPLWYVAVGSTQCHHQAKKDGKQHRALCQQAELRRRPLPCAAASRPCRPKQRPTTASSGAQHGLL